MSTSEAITLEHKRVETYRTYSPEFKAAIIEAIENNNGNLAATAKLFNLNEDTVRYWWRNSERFLEFKGASNALSDKFESIAHDYTDSLAAHDMSIVTARDKAAIIGVMVDKMQLLRGLPTSITESIERQEVAVILADALAEAIDITPKS